MLSKILKKFLAATKQLQEYFCPSVLGSVRTSGCETFCICLSHRNRTIMKFSRVITIDKSGVRAKRPMSEVKGHGHRGQSKFCPTSMSSLEQA